MWAQILRDFSKYTVAPSQSMECQARRSTVTALNEVTTKPNCSNCEGIDLDWTLVMRLHQYLTIAGLSPSKMLTKNVWVNKGFASPMIFCLIYCSYKIPVLSVWRAKPKVSEVRALRNLFYHLVSHHNSLKIIILSSYSLISNLHFFEKLGCWCK